MSKSLYSNLRQCMNVQGETIESLSEKMEISPVSLSRKINGQRQFRSAEIASATRALHIDIDRIGWLFFSDIDTQHTKKKGY